MSTALSIATALIATGCGPSSDGYAPVAPPASAASERPQPAPVVPNARPSSASPSRRDLKPPVLQQAPASGDVARFLRHAAKTAEAAGEQVVVYVGAPWCAPCRRFKKALKAGKLANRGLSGLRFIEFDHDRDVRRLNAAGYRSRYIPVFALAGDDGRASGRKFTGGSKGPGAVDTIVTRLGALLNPTQ